MNFLTRIEKAKSFWVLLGILILFFILRFPSLFEPNWYGDEGIYQSIGYGLRSGRQFYTGVWDNKPPLLFIIYALAYGEQFTARLFSLFFGFGAIVAFYFLVKKVFKENKIYLLTTVLFTIFFGLPIIEGNIANSENFMLLPIIVSAFIVYSVFSNFSHKLQSRQKWLLIIAGLSLSFSFLIKIVSIFDFSAFVLFILFITSPESIKKQTIIRHITSMFHTVKWFIAAFILPVIISILYFWLIGVGSFYADAAFGRNVDYVGWANKFIIPQGLLYIRLLLLGLFILVLFIKRNKITKKFLFIFIWLSFSLFNSFFSNRPYTHYILLLLPSFLLLIALFFQEQKTKIKAIVGLLTVFVLLAIVVRFDYWSIGRTYQYYVNYIHLITGKKTFREYQTFFDPRNPKDYATAAYIRKYTKPGDVIFLWGNSSQIYPLSKTLPPGRYSTAYHIGTQKKTVSETEDALRKTKPNYIIIMPDEQHFPFSLKGYIYRITIEDTHIYERSF